MTNRVADWLPLRTIDDPRLVEAIKGAIDQWATRWFSTGPVRGVTTKLRNSDVISANSPGWISRGHSLGFATDDDVLLSLAKHTLDVEKKVEIQPTDQLLMLALGNEMIDDFSREIAGLLGISDLDQSGALIEPFRQGGGLEIEISLTCSAESFRMAIGRSSLVSLRKSLVRSARSRPPGKVDLKKLLENEAVPFTAILGSAEICLSDAKALGVGDIIVLDTALSDPFPVVSRASHGAICAAKLVRNAGHTQLISWVG